jgi:uncharacterized protein (UPF0261 family)
MTESDVQRTLVAVCETIQRKAFESRDRALAVKIMALVFAERRDAESLLGTAGAGTANLVHDVANRIFEKN